MRNSLTEAFLESTSTVSLIYLLLPGGNSDLQGFLPRLSSDLRERIPEHSALINVSTFPAGKGIELVKHNCVSASA